MKTSLRTSMLLNLTLIVSFIGFTTALAFADGSAPAATPNTMAMLWLVIGTSAATIWGGAARYLTGRFDFFHNAAGHVVISLIGAVISAVAPVVEHGWDKAAVISAALGAIAAFVGGANSGKAGQDAANKDVTTGPGPTITKVTAFIPLAFSLALLSAFMAVPGCAHVSPSQKAYAKAFASCMQSKGIAVAPGVADEVWGDLSTGASKTVIVAQLEALAGKAGIDTVTCAVTSWLDVPTTAEKNPAGVEAANAFLQNHKASSATIVVPRG